MRKKRLRLKAILDGKAAAKYIPVAAKMLCLVEQCNELSSKTKEVMQQRIIGNSLKIISDKIGLTREAVRVIEKKACNNLFIFNEPLVSKWIELKKSKFSQEEQAAKREVYYGCNKYWLKERAKEYSQRPEVRKRYEKYHSDYQKKYHKTQKFKEWWREYQKNYYQRPEVKAKRQKYARENMRKYYKTAKYKRWLKKYNEEICQRVKQMNERSPS